MSTEIRKWEYKFTEYLTNKIDSDIKELKQFINNAGVGLKQKVVQGDYESLTASMKWLLGVRKRASATDALWDSVAQDIEMLGKYGVQVDHEVLQILETLPQEWDALKKLAQTSKEVIGPHMAEWVDRILSEEDIFRTKVMDFRGQFKAEAPLTFNISETEAYQRIDSCRIKYVTLLS